MPRGLLIPESNDYQLDQSDPWNLKLNATVDAAPGLKKH
jgi:hypothetical protein